MADSTVRLVFLGDSSRAVRSVRTLESSFGSLGKTARLAASAIGIGIVGGLAAATKAALDFDKRMRQVNSLTKLSETQFKSLEKQVLSLAKSTAQAPSTLAAGLYDIVSSGFKANDAIKVLRASAIAATAGLTDTATATKAVVAVLNAYHLNASKASHVSDILFQTVNKGVLTFEELAAQIGDVLPIAAQLGVPLEDVGGAMATITLHGVNAAEAATQLKQTLVSILKPSQDLNAEIHKMGFESGELALKQLGLEGFMRKLTEASKGSAKAFADWFPNVRAMNGALGITGKNIQTLHDNIVAMDHAQGAAGKAFAEQSKSIAVQWQKAKAALTAAAIPIGQLLFPALKAAADKMSEFATAIQAHMPEIRQQFGELAQVINTVGTTLGRLAISPGGSSALLGGLAALGTGKAIVGIRSTLADLRAGLGALGPVGIAAAVGVGLVTTAFLLNARAGDSAQRAIQGVSSALGLLRQTSKDAAQSGRLLEQAKINLATANEQVRAAEIVYARTVRESGRHSDQARAAALALRQARLNVKNATADLSAAEEKHRADLQAGSRAQTEAAQKLESLRKKFEGIRDVEGGTAVTTRVFAAATARLAAEARATAASIDRTDGAARKAASDLAKAADAAAFLTTQLNKVPSRKEIQIFIRTFGSVPNYQSTVHHHPEAKIPRRAGGGFIHGAPGLAVPILAHAGEVVLNRAQQEVLGGPRFIANLFGFSGDEGPAFAGGGFVSGFHRIKPRRKRRLQHALRLQARATSKAGEKAYAAAYAFQQREDDLRHATDQLEKGYSITPDATGSPGLDSGEIDALIAKKEELLALFDQEKKKLEEALAALQKAITALVREIKAEKDAIAADLRKLGAERRKKKPNRKVIAGLERDLSNRRKVLGTMQTELGLVRDDVKAGKRRHDFDVGFDRQDTVLDIADLQEQKREYLASLAESSDTGGGGGDLGAGGGTGLLGPDQSDLIRVLTEELGRLRQALQLQSVQVPIIASFQGGTLHVPETGLYQLHAGEQVTPANRAGRDAAGSIGDVHVEVHLNGDLAALDPYIDKRVIVNAPALAQRHGYEANRRRRAGTA